MSDTPGFSTRPASSVAVRVAVVVAILGVVAGAVLLGAVRSGLAHNAAPPAGASAADGRTPSLESAMTTAPSGARGARADLVVAPWVVVPKSRVGSLAAIAGSAGAAARRDAERGAKTAKVGAHDGWVVDSVRLTALGTRWAAADVVLADPSSSGRLPLVVTLQRAAAGARWTASAVDQGLLQGAGLAAQPAVPVPPDVGGDPALGAIVGTGALLLPGGFDGDASTRQEAAACSDCEWRKRLNCTLGNEALCGGALFGCPIGTARYQILLRKPPATTFSVVGTICLGADDELRTADQLAADVRDRFVEMLPRSRPSYQPADGALVNLPALFAVNEPSTVGPLAFTLSGYRIDLTAAAEWRWDFGDDEVLVTGSPGGRYPDRSVQHTYARPGAKDVRVTSVWTGEFTVDGTGPFPVAGDPVALTAGLAVDAREAGARLLSDG